MHALVQHGYGGAEALSLENRPVPEPGPADIRVRVLACGANASDWEFIRGYPFYARLAGGRVKGRILGSDVCGTVDKIGPGVSGLSIGQTVLADTFGHFGGFAEFCCAPARLWRPVPQGLDPVIAAALPQSGVIALMGVADRVRPGMRVLLNGAGGGSGPLALQMAVAAGAEVTAVDNALKAPLLHRLGATRVIDYRATDFAAEGQRYDHILDLWGTRSVRTIRRCLAPGGLYLLVGGPMARVVEFSFWGTAVSLLSGTKSTLLLAKQGPERLPELMNRVLSGNLAPEIGEVAALEDAALALSRMGAGQIAGKLVIRMAEA